MYIEMEHKTEFMLVKYSQNVCNDSHTPEMKIQVTLQKRFLVGIRQALQNGETAKMCCSSQ